MNDRVGKPRKDSLAGKRLQATFERRQGTVVVRLDGEMDFYSVESFKPKLARVCRAGVNNLIFDLNGMRYLDSTGLGFLFATSQELQSKGGRLVCVTPANRFVQKSLECSRAATVLKMVPSQDEAIQLFQPVSGEALAPSREETH